MRKYSQQETISRVCYSCAENIPKFEKAYHENKVVDLWFCEDYYKSALQGGYLAGRVPAADRSST